jgi:hypothetical protein
MRIILWFKCTDESQIINTRLLRHQRRRVCLQGEVVKEGPQWT